MEKRSRQALYPRALLGHLWEQDEATRRRILADCNDTGEKWDACYDHVLKTMLASHAGLVIFPLQDLLHYGSDCRMNTPGRAEGNWAWRTTEEQLAGIDWRRWHEWLELYGRIELYCTKYFIHFCVISPFDTCFPAKIDIY